MINFLRPVASIAARNSGCDQAWVEVRSIGVTSGNTSVISLNSGSARMLPFAPIVVRMVGTPRFLAAWARPATLLIITVGSID